jgi:hypothetical protein
MFVILTVFSVLAVAQTKLTVTNTAASKLSSTSDIVAKNIAVPTPPLDKLQTKDLGNDAVSGRLGL